MFDEQAFIARFEAADADEMASILRRPSLEEERALRAYLGDARYERMHSMALRYGTTRSTKQRGRVVVLHGIMGAELSAFDRKGGRSPIWVKVLRLARGQISRLRLNTDGRTDADIRFDVRATGILKKYYGEQLLALSQHWQVRAFWYDWRKSLDIAAAELDAKMRSWFDDDEPVHIVAHSMGGLVARTWIAQNPDRWKRMWDAPGKGKAGGRLIMLGTPNHGSFEIPQVLTGLQKTVRKLALIDLKHKLPDLLAILGTFPGVYQMLPSPRKVAAMQGLYRADTYSGLKVTQHYLDAAQKHHDLLADIVDKDRMVYVAGYNQRTLGGLTDLGKIRNDDAYEYTLDGDGRVSHALGLLDGVPTFYVEEEHGALPINRHVLDVMNELLETGRTGSLPATPPKRRAADTKALLKAAEAREAAQDAADEARLRAFQSRARRNGAADDHIRADEQRVEEILLRDVMSDGLAAREQPERTARVEPATIQVDLAYGSIQDLEAARLPEGAGPLEPSAVAVGHYVGVKPMGAEYALDRAISEAILGRRVRQQEDMVLAQYTERGVIRGELGQPFILPDPRTDGETEPPHRMIVIAGMGVPGRFGVPELAVLARELCWSLGRVKGNHLATVLIGAGNGNLSVEDAIDAWMRGLAQASTGVQEDGTNHLRRVTFVEYNPRRVRHIHKALLHAKESLGDLIDLQYTAWGENDLAVLDGAIEAWDLRAWEYERRRRSSTDEDARNADSIAPTRVTLTQEGNAYRLGAITEDASIPERQVQLDPALVRQANDELMAEADLRRQHERGQLLERLLVPRELRDHLATGAPLVMLLDATTARIHWEMVAQPERVPSLQDSAASGFKSDAFLGTARGLTRQLRTTFAPPPEPPPPAQRVLRVLVVADPAADAHLPGAEEEGAGVADLFEQFNIVYGNTGNRVEVTRLFGPYSATRTNVLRHLILHHYDVLHFAGHAVYDEENPALSGWIFTDGKRLSAYELDRIDRVPSFVFSNACESGITADHLAGRSSALAPSFAEAFFARGVSNFVCTAWPVDDTAARIFARTLYGGLLGLRWEADAERYVPGPTQLMHQAMRDARIAVAEEITGRQTWGAYQHYGNPYFRLFRLPDGGPDEEEAEAPRQRERAAAPTNGAAPRTPKRTTKKAKGRSSAKK